MTRLRVSVVRQGLHPSERVVSIETSDGSTEYLTISGNSLKDDTIDIGYPVGKSNGAYLVELPRETENGAWRIWIDGKLLVHKEMTA